MYNEPEQEEAIELASLVEELQDEIIVDYFKYKGALIKLKKCREQLLLHNKNYSDALQKNNSLDIALASSQWEEELIEEYRLKQEVKKYLLWNSILHIKTQNPTG